MKGIEKLIKERPDLKVEVTENGFRVSPLNPEADLYGDYRKIKPGEDSSEAEKELFKEMAKLLNDLAEDPERRGKYIIRHTAGDYDTVGLKISISIPKER